MLCLSSVDHLLLLRNFVICSEVADLLIELGYLFFVGKRVGSPVIMPRTFLYLLSPCQDKRSTIRGKQILFCIYTLLDVRDLCLSQLNVNP